MPFWVTAGVLAVICSISTFLVLPKPPPSDEVRPRGGGCRCLILATTLHGSYGLRAANLSSLDEREFAVTNRHTDCTDRARGVVLAAKTGKTVLTNVPGIIGRKRYPGLETTIKTVPL
jgi:hypothetical protein